MEPYRLPQVGLAADPRRCLDLNECQLEHCPQLRRVISREAEGGSVSVYPRDATHQMRLIGAIRRYLRDDSIAPGNVLLTRGSDSALKLVCDGFNDPRMDVMVPVPTYHNFLTFVRSVPHRAVRAVPICVDDTDAAVYEKVSGALGNMGQGRGCGCGGMVYLVLPNNPLGYTLPVEAVDELSARHPHTLFVVDEAYAEFAEPQRGTCAGLASARPNVVVTRTFSKFFGLAALRIGYLVAHRDVVGHLRRLHNDKDVSALAQQAALCVLENADHYAAQHDASSECRRYLQERLGGADAAAGDVVTRFSFRCGMFCLLFSSDPAMLADHLRLRGFYLRDKSAEVPGALRVSLASPPVFRELVDACVELNELCRARSNRAQHE